MEHSEPDDVKRHLPPGECFAVTWVPSCTLPSLYNLPVLLSVAQVMGETGDRGGTGLTCLSTFLTGSWSFQDRSLAIKKQTKHWHTLIGKLSVVPGVL